MRASTISHILVLAVSSLATAAVADVGDLRITEVNPATGEVEVTNLSPDAFATTSILPFLHRLNSSSSIPNPTMFAGGESKVFTVTGLNATDSDLWLYRDTDFGSSASVITGLKYGPLPDVGQVDVAVAAGIWPSTSAFVPAPSVGQTLQLIAYDHTTPESWESASPRLATFFGDGVEIITPLPAIRKAETVIELQTIAEGLVSPLGMAAPNDGTGRLFIYDQTGRILIWQTGSILPTPFLDVSSLLVTLNTGYDERGLLGLALHPDFATNGKLYTYTSEPPSATPDFPSPGGVRNHQSVLAEWVVQAQNPNVVDVPSRREILRIDQPQGNHNAGDMHFGPDGLLYIALGDGGAADDEGAGHSPQGNAQDTTNVLGSILRIDVNGTNSANGQYGIPPDNPFVGTTGVDEIFANGLRNPYRFSFDRVGGTLYVGDVGQNDIEEVDIVTNGGNYGWRVKEGSFFFEPDGGFPTTLPAVPIPSGVVDPIAEYDHDDGNTVLGGYVYRGTAIPQLVGRYICGDWSGRLFFIDDKGDLLEFTIGMDDRALGFRVKGFAQDPEGEVYVVGTTAVGPSGDTGRVVKIVPVSTPGLRISSIQATDSVLDFGFTSPQPLAQHVVEARLSLIEGDWADISATLTDLGSRAFSATLNAPSGNQEFYRIRAGDYGARISGEEVVGGSDSLALGQALFIRSPDGKELSYKLFVTGIENVSQAHIHLAPPGTSGGVVAWLYPPSPPAHLIPGTFTGLLATGTITDDDLAGSLAGQTVADLITAIEARNTYVNIHTSQYPGGEIRGQID